MNLQWKVTRGVRVNLIVAIALNLLRAVVLAVLARLLSPSDYGLVAAALVVVNPVKQILFNGVEQAAVLQSDLRPGATTSLFWMATGAAVAGIAILSIVVGLSPISSEFRNTIIALSFILLGLSLALVPRVLLRRELAFGRLAIAEATSMILGFGVVSVAAALAGYGSLSLVYGYVGQALIRALVSFLLCPGAVRGWCFDFQAVRPILSMAVRITKVSVLEIVHAQIMPAFIGAGLGTARLGQFSQATLLVEVPIQIIALSMTQVVSTGFRIVRDEVVQLRETCQRLIETASAITLPLCFGAAAAALPLVDVVLGPQWAEAGRVMPWLALGAACGVLGHFLGVMNEAAGRLEEKFLIQLVVTILLVLTLFFAVRIGLRECAQAYSFCAFVYLAGQAVLAGRTMRAGIAEMLGWIAPGCICSALIYGCVSALQLLFPTLSPILQLGLDIACCAILFFGLYTIFYPRLQRELLSLALPGKRSKIELVR